MRVEQIPVTGRAQKKQLTPQMRALSEFYQALNTRDMNLMARNWAQTNEAVMDNPVGGIKRGWEEIRTVYEQIFSSPGQYCFEFYDYSYHLVVLIKRLLLGVDVVGLDPDPEALARGRRKAERGGVSIRFDQGFSDELPYPAASFDRVVSSFMFHHLQPDEKEKTLREVRRVLKPGGSFHLLDLDEPAAGPDGFLARWLHSTQRLRDNDQGRILTLLMEAGLADSERVSQGTRLFLRVAYYQAAVFGSEAAVPRDPRAALA